MDLLQKFTFRAAVLSDYGFKQGRSYNPLVDVWNPDLPGDGIHHLDEVTRVNLNQNIFTKVQTDWLLTYKNSFNDHNLTAMAGWTSRSEEHTFELRSLMRISYAFFCLTNKSTTYYFTCFYQ